MFDRDNIIDEQDLAAAVGKRFEGTPRTQEWHLVVELERHQDRESWVSWAIEFVRRGLWPADVITVHRPLASSADRFWGEAGQLLCLNDPHGVPIQPQRVLGWAVGGILLFGSVGFPEGPSNVRAEGPPSGIELGVDAPLACEPLRLKMPWRGHKGTKSAITARTYI